MSSSRISTKTLRLTEMAILAAIVVVLQLLSYSIKIGVFNLSLVLIPIVVGAALLGVRAGMLLGLVFGIVALLASVFGMDAGGAILWQANPLVTTLICLVKGGAAGAVSGLIIAAFRKTKHARLGTWIGALAAPLVNSGLFVIGMLLAFYDILRTWAEGWQAGVGTMQYIVFGLLGGNFLVEFALSALFAPIVLRIVEAVQKSRN
ncbi:MAG: energy-coupled thiamine transporter ThiT [Clostridia bacterium]|nr:energy-coupled thiamine transporter ThiT [Clostridia bacterium]MBQ8494416.1 energy-coupled thiamine transporter ThiT [Clostridia bacterium]